MTISRQTAFVTFTDKNPDVLLDTGGIAGTVVASVVGIGLLGVGFFAYRKYHRNGQSRKQEPFAATLYKSLKPVDAANFNSTKGQLFIQAVKKLESELFQQGIDTTRMGSWELDQLAEQTTLAIQYEISSRVNWRGESFVSGDIIQQHATALALAIQKIRVGGYDMS